MGLLKPATNGTAHLKLGILGFEGSGKTYTAVDFAIGMAKLTKGTKVAFFDTEKGSDFHIDRFKKAGVQLDVVKSRSFLDLVNTIKEAETNNYSFLIIDSITHVWRELTASYLKKMNRKNLTMKDWGVLKAEWAQYTDLYVNSKVSIAMLGRAGYEYDVGEDEDGKQEITKSGTKMKVETETGFEPDLLLEMYRERKSVVTKNKKEKGFVNRCLILKDRTDTMNGQMLTQPKFKDFQKIISFLNIGGEHVGVDTTRSSEQMFGKPDYSHYEAQRQRDIALEEIDGVLLKAGLDGRSDAVKKERAYVIEQVFGTVSKTKIENMHYEALREKLAELKALLIKSGHLKKEEGQPIENGKAPSEEEIPY